MVEDRVFKRSYDASVAAGLITAVYQFADYRTFAKNNVAALAKLLAGRKPAFVAIDLEQNERYWPGLWPSNGAALTAWVSDYITAYRLNGFTCPVVFYTNLTTIQQMRAAPASLKMLVLETPLWLAWYDMNEPTPAMFAPWPKYIIRQPRPSAVGKQYGMESGNLDLDYWNGDLAGLQAFVGQAPAEVSDAEKLSILWAEYKKTH